MVDQLPENEVQPALELIRGRVAQQVAAAAQMPLTSPPQHRSSSGTPSTTATTQNLAFGRAAGRATAQPDRPLDAVYAMLFTDVIETPRRPGGQPIYVIFEGHHSCCKSKLSDAIQPDPVNTRIHN